MSKNIQIIIGSTRQNRLGGQVADWVKDQAVSHPDINVEVIDLKEENLPFFDAATPPAYGPDQTPAGKAWAAKIARGDGYIFVTPEYNRGIPAALKNALDFLVAEWQDKPAAIVSYGWIDGGDSASRHLRDVLGWLKLSTSDEAVRLKLTADMMDDTGAIKDPATAFADYQSTFGSALDEVVAHRQPVAA